jgi:hypothetical protein
VAKIIRDPLGNEIVVNEKVLEINHHIMQIEDSIDDFRKVIERPAMLFKMAEGIIHLYYFRAVGWHKTILIGVQKIDQHFEVIHYQFDPTLNQLAELQSKGQRLL